MTTTNVYQGMDTNAKLSSRVLNPPGGRSNFSLGGDPEPPAKPKPSNAQQISSSVIGTAAQSAKPKSEANSFNTLGFGDADSATDLAAQRAAYQKRNQASSFMFSGEEKPASVPPSQPKRNEPKPPPKVERPATNCNEVNPITNQSQSPVAANNDSPSRVSLINKQKKIPNQHAAAGAKVEVAWEDSHRQRTQPPGGKSSIIF